MENMSNKRDFIISLITLAVVVGLIVLLFVMLMPILTDIFTDRNGKNLIEIIHSHGARGVPVLACLQALQVITTVVPAILIQIPAGLVYGTWTGLLICLAGSVLGNVIVFTTLRQLSTTIDHIFPTRRKRREEKARKPKKKSRLPFFLNPESLNRMPHPELVAFYVYMIPGIPNGVLPHIFSRTKVSFARYLIAVVAGNAPSTLVCTLVGDRLSQGDWRGAVIIILIFAACIGIALLMRRKLIALISGGYSLNLPSAVRKRAESSNGAVERAGEASSGNEVVEIYDNKAVEEVDGVGAVVDNSVVVADVVSGDKPEADDEAGEIPDEPDDAAPDPIPDDETDDEDMPDDMQALGTIDIAPHGWRIIKGKKP
jgi:uncharacterized membrane protein YdjX (TVP38/TMEM64 family)